MPDQDKDKQAREQQADEARARESQARIAPQAQAAEEPTSVIISGDGADGNSVLVTSRRATEAPRAAMQPPPVEEPQAEPKARDAKAADKA